MSNKSSINNIKVFLLYCFCRGIAILPYHFNYYILQGFVYFVLRYILRYRRKLIIRQLSECFPEKSEAERHKIKNDYYHNLAEYVIDMICMAGMTDSERLKRIKFEVSEEDKGLMNKGHVVLVTSHYGFWEYYAFFGMQLPDHKAIIAYHALASRTWNELFTSLRTFANVVPIDKKTYVRHAVNKILEGKDKMIFGLVADQSAKPTGDIHWYDFLNHKSLFFDGPEQLARKYHIPTFYMAMHRLRRGYYQCELSRLYDGAEDIAHHQLTQRYVVALENTIKQEPALWMWSHNRWKRKYTPTANEK